jgi:hypothetical protein
MKAFSRVPVTNGELRTEEGIKYVLKPMFAEKKEPTWSMGDGTLLA